VESKKKNLHKQGNSTKTWWRF